MDKQMADLKKLAEEIVGLSWRRGWAGL